MIEPLVKETDWLQALNALQAWDPPMGPVLIVAPHPDDETLGAGGFIAAQRLADRDIVVAAVTDGENAYGYTPGLAALRQVEQTNALARLGVPSGNIIRFGLPDSDVASREDELVERLARLISQHTHVIAPWQGDFHPDHAVCGRAAEKVALQTGARLTSYFFWTWHYGTPTLLNGLPLRSFRLTEKLLLAKTQALLCHRSQLVHPTGEPVLPESLLGPARRPFEVFSVA